MKKAWDVLIDDYADSSSILIADVDCTAAGKSLCTEVGVRGYPTIKYGPADDLKDYSGGRTLKDLRDFAATLGPICGPQNLDLCAESQKAQIAEFTAMGAEKREALIKEQAAEIEQVEVAFAAAKEAIQKEYSEGSTKKDALVQAVKDSGLGLLKAVSAFKKQRGEEL